MTLATTTPRCQKCDAVLGHHNAYRLGADNKRLCLPCRASAFTIEEIDWQPDLNTTSEDPRALEDQRRVAIAGAIPAPSCRCEHPITDEGRCLMCGHS